MALIPDHILEQVRQSNDIVDVIGSYFPLKRAGASFRALCPFHKEKTPSFNVNPQKQIWHCFGCGVGGDVFKFVMKYENLDFMDAVRRLAERAGIRLEFEPATAGPTRDQRDLLFKLHEQAAEFYHGTLLREKSAQIARDYLQKRAISIDTAKRWRIGYAPDAWDGLIQWARARKFSVALLETAGLILSSERGEGEARVYDRFRGRLMFPIGDEQGRVVGFSGRILTDAKDQPKYVNSPETPIFQKGKILFALDKAKRAIIEQKQAILCEGQVDTISCHEAGVANVIAPQGTAFTEHHARILKRYADEVVLMFDADEAGQNAAVRNAEPLWEAGFLIRVVVLPEGHDPDSLVKREGPERLQALLAGAEGFLEFLLARLSRQFDPRTDRGKLQIVDNIVGWLCRIPSPTLQASFAQRTAARLGVAEEVIREEMKKFRHRSARPAVAEPEPPAETETVRPANAGAEEQLLQLMLADDRLIELVQQRLDRAWLSGSVAAGLIARVLDLAAAKRWTDPGALLGESPDDDASSLVSRLLLSPAPAADRAPAAANDCLVALERQWVEQQWRALRQQLSRPGLAAPEMAQLQQQALDLRRRLDHIATLSMRKGSTPAHENSPS